MSRARRLAILVCAIAASTPRKRRECVYTGALVVKLGVRRKTRAEKKFFRSVIGWAQEARDKAAGTGHIDRRTQATDAEAEAWLRCL